MTETTRNVQRIRQQGQRIGADTARAGRAAKVAFVAGLRGAHLREAVAGLTRQEAQELAESRSASRAVRIAVVSRLDDADLLVSIAAGPAETFVRRNALQRLDELQQAEPLSRSQLERLVCCLRCGELLPWAVALMDAAGFDWCARSDAAVADALCAALYGCSGIQEEVVVDDAFAQLAHCRPDLAGSLRSCSPERFLPQALQPSVLRTITLVDIARCDDVA